MRLRIAVLSLLLIGMQRTGLCQSDRAVDSLQALVDTTLLDTVQLRIQDALYWHLYLTPSEATVTQRIGRIADALLLEHDTVLVRAGHRGKVMHLNALGYRALGRNDQLSALRFYQRGGAHAASARDAFSIGLMQFNIARIYRSVNDAERAARDRQPPCRR